MFTRPRSKTRRTTNLLSQAAAYIIWVPDVPKPPQYTFLTISNVQYIIALLWTQLYLIKPDSQDSISSLLLKVCKTFLFKNILSNGSTYLIMCVYVYFLLALSLLGFLCFKLIRKKPLSRIQEYISFMCSQFHLSYGFWATSSLLFDCLITPSQYQLKFFGVSLSNIGLSILNATLLALNYILTVFISFYSYDPFKGSNVTSMHNPIFQVLTFLYKGIALGLSTLNLDNTVAIWVLLAFSLAFSLIRHYSLFGTFPYYEFYPLNLAFAWSSASIAISGLNCLLMVLHGEILFISGASIICFNIFFTILGIKLNQNFFEKSVQKFLSISDGELSSESDVITKVFVLEYIINAKVSFNKLQNHEMMELQFWNTWMLNQNKLPQLEESDNSLKHNDQPFQANYSGMINDISHHILLESVQRFPSSSKLKILLANSIIYRGDNPVLAFYYLQQLSDQRLSDRIIASLLFKNCQYRLHRELEEALDVKEFLEFDGQSSTFVKKIYSNSTKYVDFWKSYQQTSLKLLDLASQSDKIEEEDILIKNYWRRFQLKDKFFSDSLRTVYGIYLSLVRNARYSASKLQESNQRDDYYFLKQYSLHPDTLLTIHTLSSPDNIMLHVSMAKDSLGEVVDLSSNISGALEWDKNSLIGRNISIILPQFMREKHNRLLEQHLNGKMQSTRLFKTIESFVRNKSGNILPCYIYLCLHPDIQHKMVYLGILRIKETDEEHIILDQKGYVQGFTKSIGSRIGLVEDEKTHIQEFCTHPKILKLFRASSTGHKFGSFLPKIGTSYSSEDKYEVRSAKNSPIRNGKKNKLAWDCRFAISDYEYYDTLYYVLSVSTGGISLEKGVQTLYPFSKQLKAHQSKLRINIENTFDLEDEAGDEMLYRRHLSKVQSPEKEKLQVAEREQINDPFSNLNLRKTDSDVVQTPLIHLNSSLKYSTEEENAYLNTQRNTQRALLSDMQLDQDIPDNLGDPGRTSIMINRPAQSTDSSYKLRAEQAIYYVPRNRGMRVLNALFVLTILFTGVILIVFQYQNTKVMKTVTDNVEIVGASITRLTRIINLYGLTLYLPLLDSQTIFDDRLKVFSTPALRNLTIARFSVISKDLADSSTKVFNLVSGLDQKLTAGLYESFLVHDFDESGGIVATRYFNSFDLITQFRAIMLRLSKRPSNEIYGNNTDIQFVRSNALNQLLTSCEEGINVIVGDTNIKVGDLTQLITLFLCLIAGLSILLIFVTINTIREFLRDREKLFNVFRQLDEYGIRTHLETVQNFCTLLQENEMSIQSLSHKIKDRDLFGVNYRADHSTIRRGKPVNMRGIHTQISKVFSLVLALIILLSSGCLITFSVMTTQNDTIIRKIGLMVETNIDLYYTYLRFSTINQYIGQDTNFTLRSEPYAQEFDRISVRLASTNDLYSSVIDKDIGFGQDPLIVGIFTGNLCQLVPSAWVLSVGNPCDKMMGGVASKGMIAVANAFRYLVESMKAAYDASNKTHEVAVSLLNTNEFIEGQGIVAGYLLTGCDKIGLQVKNQLSKDAKAFTDSISKLTIVYVIIYFVLGSIGWWKVRDMFMKEKAKWRRLIRLVPELLISNDKLLQNYLYSSGGVIQFAR